MKRKLSLVTLMAVMAGFILAGCDASNNNPPAPSTNAPAVPTPPSTNAPVAPK